MGENGRPTPVEEDLKDSGLFWPFAMSNAAGSMEERWEKGGKWTDTDVIGDEESLNFVVDELCDDSDRPMRLIWPRHSRTIVQPKRHHFHRIISKTTGLMDPADCCCSGSWRGGGCCGRMGKRRHAAGPICHEQLRTSLTANPFGGCWLLAAGWVGWLFRPLGNIVICCSCPQLSHVLARDTLGIGHHRILHPSLYVVRPNWAGLGPAK